MPTNEAMVSTVLLLVGGGIFVFLAGLHAIYTYRDTRNPRTLVPDDPAVRHAMGATGVRLARGRMSMWDAWVGFNFSHSWGGLLIAGLAIALAVHPDDVPLKSAVFPLLVSFSAAYLVVGLRYWFRVPTAGIAIATACFLVAWILYLLPGLQLLF